MRAFVTLRGMLAKHVELKNKLTQLAEKYDRQFRVIFEAIHQFICTVSLFWGVDPEEITHKTINNRYKLRKYQ
jgi:predicted transcriptional regulator